MDIAAVKTGMLEREDAGLTRRIPSDISSPISARHIMISLP